jgi:HEPN domain-containing protein
MGPREARYSQEYALELMSIADADLESAKALAKVERQRIENVFFLAHQALEKALKAVLCWRKISVPTMVHDIGILVTKIATKEPPPFGYELNSLTEYATIRRYLEGKEKFTSDEVSEILAQVEAAIKWCRQQIT